VEFWTYLPSLESFTFIPDEERERLLRKGKHSSEFEIEKIDPRRVRFSGHSYIHAFITPFGKVKLVEAEVKVVEA